MKFQPGDLVVLKSGGPSMTVSTVDNTKAHSQELVAKWFSPEGELKSASFYSSSLKKVEESPAE